MYTSLSRNFHHTRDSSIWMKLDVCLLAPDCWLCRWLILKIFFFQLKSLKWTCIILILPKIGILPKWVSALLSPCEFTFSTTIVAADIPKRIVDDEPTVYYCLCIMHHLYNASLRWRTVLVNNGTYQQGLCLNEDLTVWCNAMCFTKYIQDKWKSCQKW